VRPPLFIGSSKESLTVAYALQQNLEDCAEVTVWTQGMLELTSTALQSLLKALLGTIDIGDVCKNTKGEL